jgi:hypothetical protein
MVELSLTRPEPERITFHYLGVKRAFADGSPCDIDGGVIASDKFSRLVVEF